MNKNKHIFLSYSRVDTKFAKRIAEDLRAQGFEVWMDQSHIPGGKHWDNHIEEALKNASSVVLIISPASADSENVKDEISYAKNRAIRIIPVVYQPTVTPLGWDRLQWINLYKNYDNGLNELVKTLTGKTTDEDEIQPPRYRKKIIYALLGVGLVVLGYMYLLPKVLLMFDESKQNPKVHVQNTSLEKRNTVIIGNNNQDINISQE